MTGAALEIEFAPLLPVSWIIALAFVALAALLLAFWTSRRFSFWRSLTLGVFILALLNPALLEEQRSPARDVVVIVQDQSPSQSFAARAARTNKALAYLQETLGRYDGLDVRVVKAPDKNMLSNDTLLFEALEKTLADVPPALRAGVIFLSDGQIHDVPTNTERYKEFGPVHILLSGEKNEKDRQLVILEAPSYGIIGQTITMRYKVEDTANIGAVDATITLSHPGERPEVFVVPIGREMMLDLPIIHTGQNVYEISVQSVDDEITTSNNRAALMINGVRDRLKVLLVSGKPHAGGRTWRDLLTDDPGVDLVHFTILREPTKLDATPQNELALIAFPFRELFEIKLYDFDLIIFDRYQVSRILPEHYFENIVRYVEGGGALLEASGPSFAGEHSLYETSLANILPGAPTGAIIKKAYRPATTKAGDAHPVTKNLLWSDEADGTPTWGRWLRQIAITPQSGDVLMTGADENPLLILDRVAQGRIAQIASDHIWLWSRGYDGGGPHTELLRRIVHWLMKEPELDEQAIAVSVKYRSITLRTQNYKNNNHAITVTKPDGTEEAVELEQGAENTLTKTIEADQLGIYGFETESGQKRYAVIGDLNPPELSGVKTTEDKILPLLQDSGGGAIWLSETAQPKIRMLSERGYFSGHGWLGLRQNKAYTITGVQSRPLLPPALVALTLLTLMITTWWREGRRT